MLRNADGILLTLMYDKRMTAEQGYPGIFHVGFLQPTQHAVDLMHDALSARNYMARKPAKLQRGGPPTYGFYYDALGGVIVEVSTMNIATRLTAALGGAGENLHSHPPLIFYTHIGLLLVSARRNGGYSSFTKRKTLLVIRFRIVGYSAAGVPRKVPEDFTLLLWLLEPLLRRHGLHRSPRWGGRAWGRGCWRPQSLWRPSA